MRAFVPATLLFSLGVAQAARSQQTPTLPASGVDVVRLDAVVTNAHGALVRSLGQEEFQVFEDGKLQHVSVFLPVIATGSPDVLQPARDAPVSGGPAPPPAPSSAPPRNIAIVVDDLHLGRGNLDYTRKALHELVDGYALAGDNVGLFTTSSGSAIQGLTQDRAIVKQAIDALSFREAGFERAGAQLTPAQAELVLRGDPSALKLGARSLLDDPGSGFDDKIRNLSPSKGYTPAGINEDEKAAAEEIQRQARAVLVDALRFSVATLSRTDSVIRGLAPLPGRKVCILVSDGFLVGTGTSEERTQDLLSIVDAATRSGAVVYALDAQGLTSRVSDAGLAGKAAPPGLEAKVARQSESLFRTTLETISRDTGGFLVRATNDLAGGLRRMLQDNEAYYLVAYEPANLKRDGKFRKIEVRIAGHRDYVVRTRKGYLAVDPGAARAAGGSPVGLERGAPAPSLPRRLDEGEARALLGAPLPTKRLPLRMAADYLELPSVGPQAVVRGALDLTGVKWDESDGRHRASIDFVGGVYDSEGGAVGAPFTKRVELDLGKSDYERARKEGLRYQQQLALSPGRYQIRLLAREMRQAQAGAATEWLEIPDLADRKLAMSSVFVSSSTPPPSGPQAPEGGDTIRSMQAARNFKRSEKLFFQFYVYNVVRDATSAHDVVFQAQIKTGDKLVGASKPRPVALETKDATPLPETNEMGLDALTPGPYELRVLVVDRTTNVSVQRTLDFTVE